MLYLGKLYAGVRTIILFLGIISFISCERTHTYQAGYEIEFLGISSEDIYISTNPLLSDFDSSIAPKKNIRRYPGEVSYGTMASSSTWMSIAGSFKGNRFPKSLDNIFLIQNKSDKKQKCFIFISGGYPSKKLLYDRTIPPNNIKIIEIKSKSQKLIKEKKLRDLERYWEEIHISNKDLALELNPQEKIYIKWK